MRILFSADHHIKLGQKNVPVDWQINRFLKLGEELHKIYQEHNCDLHIIGGDILDVAKPSTEELDLMYLFLKQMPHNGLIYTGNHEMRTKKLSCLAHLANIINSSTEGNWTYVEDYRSKDFDIIPYTVLHHDVWREAESKVCFTHVRGEIPPHVVPEIDLGRFAKHGYEVVFAGDLHSYQNTQEFEGLAFNYPGSPLTTSFHRERTKNTNGVFIIDTDNMDLEWIELGHLPQLIRKTVKAGEKLIEDPYDRVIYEVEGDMLELKGVENSDLVDKKINKQVTKEAKLNLENLGTLDELALYLREVQGFDNDTISRLVSRAATYVGN